MDKLEYIEHIVEIILSKNELLDEMQNGNIEIDSDVYNILEMLAEEQQTTVEEIFSEAIMFYITMRDKSIDFYQDSTNYIIN